MGADFTFVSCPMPYNLKEGEAEKLLTERVMALDDSEFENLLDELYFDVDETPTRLQIVNMAIEYLDDLSSPRRDLGEIILYDSKGRGAWHWMTGGMSWGDDPTDAYNPMARLSTIVYATGLQNWGAIDDDTKTVP